VVAAADERFNIGEGHLGEQLAQVIHLHGVAADVDGTEEGDVARHCRTPYEIKSRLISATDAQPHSPMAKSTSNRSNSSTRSTPRCPSWANPHNTGRPTATAFAP